MIPVRFIHPKLNGDFNLMPQVPAVGEFISLRYYDYQVIRVTWGIEANQGQPMTFAELHLELVH